MDRELGDVSGVALANILLGYVALSRNDLDQAEELCVEAVRIFWERAQIPGMDFALDVLASVAAARGELSPRGSGAWRRRPVMPPTSPGCQRSVR